MSGVCVYVCMYVCVCLHRCTRGPEALEEALTGLTSLVPSVFLCVLLT